MAQLRSVHGGADSHLCVEVSAVRGFDDPNGIGTCNDEPDESGAFSVYIRNPLAMHIRDFHVLRRNSGADKRGRLDRAKARAFTWADALAEHLGCPVVSALQR